MDVDDMQLVREFAATGSDRAFSEIVSRHADLVYSVAFRQVRDPQLAQDITQAVFILLSRKAARLGRRVILPAWLCRTARFVSFDVLKRQRRRREREKEACMQARGEEPESADWEKISPWLDAAMERLGGKEHDALVLRFFKGRSFAEVGEALGISEAAAKMRVSRGLEKLRTMFRRRGVALSSSALFNAFSLAGLPGAAIALPAGWKGAAGGAVTALADGAWRSMAWLKLKAGIGAGAAALVATGTLAATAVALRPAPWQVYPPPASVLERVAPRVEVRPTKFSSLGPYWISGNGRMLGFNLSLAAMMREAYGVSPGRIVLPAGFPSASYDYIANLPSGSADALQRKIREVTGFSARREVRDTDVLRLGVMRSDAPGLKRARAGAASSGGFGDTNFSGTNKPIADLTAYLEGVLGRPVIDETGLTGNFDVDVKWSNGRNWDAVDPAALKQALADQLGLALTPARQPVEMLIVERERGSARVEEVTIPPEDLARIRGGNAMRTKVVFAKPGYVTLRGLPLSERPRDWQLTSRPADTVTLTTFVSADRCSVHFEALTPEGVSSGDVPFDATRLPFWRGGMRTGVGGRDLFAVSASETRNGVGTPVFVLFE